MLQLHNLTGSAIAGGYVCLPGHSNLTGSTISLAAPWLADMTACQGRALQSHWQHNITGSAMAGGYDCLPGQ